MTMAEVRHSDTPAGTPGPRHEPSDLKPRTILIFGIILSVTVLLCLLIANWMFHYFAAVQTQSSPPLSPLATREAPPGPRLQAHAPEDLRKFRAEEEATLNSYGWVNQQTGIVRIPIDRAMQLLVQRGLQTPGQPGQPAASQKTPSAPSQKGQPAPATQP
jgi:hypothetical protein